MVDLETLATSQDCVILTLGAVRFERTGDGSLSELYLRICPEQEGRKVCAETMTWWEGQPSREEAFSPEGRIPLSEALDLFLAFSAGCERIWCQGANFDVPILEHALEQHGKEPTWKYWQVRDTRTMYDLVSKRFPSNGHNALEDAKQQVLNVQDVFRSLGGLPPTEISFLPDNVVERYKKSKKRRDPFTKVRDLCFLSLGKGCRWGKNKLRELNVEDVSHLEFPELNLWREEREKALQTYPTGEEFDHQKLFFSLISGQIQKLTQGGVDGIFSRVCQDLQL